MIIIDVDECQVNNGGCDQTCTNTDGSFICSCDPGLILSDDNFNCEGICHAQRMFDDLYIIRLQ